MSRWRTIGLPVVLAVSGLGVVGNPAQSRRADDPAVAPATILLLRASTARATIAPVTTVPPAGVSALSVAAAPEDVALVQSESDALLAAVLPTGAIAHHGGDRNRIVPYAAHYAAIALARSSIVLNQRSGADAAWGWLRWYADRQAPDGRVNDHAVDGPTEQDTGFVDATDADAGLFLLAVDETWRAQPRPDALVWLLPAVRRAVTLLDETVGPDGLYRALPSFWVAYAMDNAEVAGGLAALRRFAVATNDPKLRSAAADRLARLRAGLNQTWQDADGSYLWAIHRSGRDTTNWSRRYPDSMQQAWLVAFGLVDVARSQRIVSRLDADQASWLHTVDGDDASTAARAGSAIGVGTAWPLAAAALNRVSQTDRSRSAASAQLEQARDGGRKWPWSVAEAGQALIVLTGGLPTLDGD